MLSSIINQLTNTLVSSTIVTIPGWGTISGIGLKILGVVALIELCKQAYNLARGAEADFTSVVARYAIAAITIAAIPTLAKYTASTVMDISNYLFDLSTTATLEASYRTGMAEFGCNQISGLDVLALFVSPSGWLMIGAQLIVVLTLLVKYVLIDVIWPLYFNLIVFAGALTLPLGFIKDLGGMKVFVKNVISVALWPILFAILMSVLAASFPDTLSRVADGKAKIDCSMIIESQAKLNAIEKEQYWNGIKSLLHYIAISIGAIFFLIKIPSFASSLLGVESTSGAVSQLMGSVSSKSEMAAGKGRQSTQGVEKAIKDRTKGVGRAKHDG